MQDDFGETALVAAVRQGHTHITDILVKNGANIKLPNQGENIDHYFSLIAAPDGVGILIH